jgi:hypothetical protein
VLVRSLGILAEIPRFFRIGLIASRGEHGMDHHHGLFFVREELGLLVSSASDLVVLRQ